MQPNRWRQHLEVAALLSAVGCEPFSEPEPGAGGAAPTATTAPASIPSTSPTTPRRVLDGQAMALALSETSDDCRTALAAASDFASGRPGAWERLDRLEDPLGRAFKGFGHYLAGRFGRAERMRELLVAHQLARTPNAPLLVQHIELIRGTLAHCSDETRESRNGRVVVPAALCWPWRVAPEAAARAYASTEDSWSSAWSPEACGRPSPRRRTQPGRAPCVDSYYGLGVSQSFDASLRCAIEHGQTRLHVVQLLNGQGTARDLTAAVKVYESAAYWGHFNVRLEWELDQRLAEPEHAFPDVDYCDFAAITSDTGECSKLEFRRTEQRSAVERARVRAHLDREASGKLDALHLEFSKNREAQAEIEGDDSFGGTGSGGLVFYRKNHLEQRHVEHLQRWLVARKFRATSLEQLADARRLEADVIRQQAAAAAPPNDAPARTTHLPPEQDHAQTRPDPEDWMAQERLAIGRRRPQLLERERQSAERYRQLWVWLAQRGAARPLSPEAVERAVLVALLHEHVEQLTNESFVPPWR